MCGLAGRPQDQERGDAILSVTLDILGERGYAGLTVAEIVARARVSKSTIYRRWPTKEELAIAAFDRLPELEVVDRGDLLEELLDLIGQYQQFLELIKSFNSLYQKTSQENTLE